MRGGEETAAEPLLLWHPHWWQLSWPPVRKCPPLSCPAAEDALRASGVPFAIVRPCALTEEPAGMPLVIDQGDTIKGKVSREVRGAGAECTRRQHGRGAVCRMARRSGRPAPGNCPPASPPSSVTPPPSAQDIAELCVALLRQPAASSTTFEVGSTVPFSQPWQVDAASPPPPRDWTALLQGAGLRRGVTGKTVDGVYTGKEPEPAGAAAAAAVPSAAASSR